MGFSVECAVRSKIVLAGDINYRDGEMDISLSRDTKGLWNRIRVVAPVKRPQMFKWGMQPVKNPAPGAAPWHINAAFDKELYNDIISSIQCIESTVSVLMPLESINWGSPLLNVIFEHDNEKPPADWAPLLDMKRGRGEIQNLSGKDEAFLALAVVSKVYRPLVDILSFYREGNNELAEAKFINAFYNYYFVLEGLYGNGKTKNQQVLEAFRSNGDLREHLERHLREKHDIRHICQVKAMLDRIKKKPCFEDLMHLLVHTRGDLHHFINNPKRPQPSPLNHEDFEGITFLAKDLAHKGILAAMLRLNPTKP